MSTAQVVPFIPDNAPFSLEQRAWLNGYLAGLFSVQQQPDPSLMLQGEPASPPTPVTILYGTQTGTAESLARQVAKAAKQRGLAPHLLDMQACSPDVLQETGQVLLLTSTYGEGDMPDNAQDFWDWLNSDDAPSLAHLSYSVLALGDSYYEHFCEAGKCFDRHFERLGARRLYPRVECDVDYDEPFAQWLDGVLEALADQPANRGDGAVSAPTSAAMRGDGASSAPENVVVAPSRPAFSRRNPFPARLLTNRRLTGAASSKETRHLELSIDGSGLTYEAGDALGIVPTNCPRLVEDILNALGATGDEPVSGPNEAMISFREALRHHYEITQIPRALLQAVAEQTQEPDLVNLLGAKDELASYLRGREVIDVLLAYPQISWSPDALVHWLRKLSPRLYSISSSPKVHPGEVHLTVGVVRYDTHGRNRKGVCSTYLADRAGDNVPVYIQPNKHFRPPADHTLPMIMVGPGTGIAPFRAFLQERRATGATGKNWLFFGDQHAESDFLYQDELLSFFDDGTLTRLDTAFSRDQDHKIYVQHRMLEHADALYGWLEEGASFFVCGDAGRMAKDVDAALHQVIEQAGGMHAEQAGAYVQDLKKARRYVRDVY